MASRADRLQIVLELAEQAENDAADIFNKARSQHEREHIKLNDLANYCSDYQTSLASASGLQTAESIVRSRGFLSQLVEAKRQQQQIVTQFLKLADQKKQIWHKAHLKHRAMKDLIQRLREDEQKILSKQEEKMLDEWVTIGFARKELNSDGARL